MVAHEFGCVASLEPIKLLELTPEVVSLLQRPRPESQPNEGSDSDRSVHTNVTSTLPPCPHPPLGPGRISRRGRRRYPILQLKCDETPPPPSQDPPSSSEEGAVTIICSAHTTYEVRYAQTSNLAFVAKSSNPGAFSIREHALSFDLLAPDAPVSLPLGSLTPPVSPISPISPSSPNSPQTFADLLPPPVLSDLPEVAIIGETPDILELWPVANSLAVTDLTDPLALASVQEYGTTALPYISESEKNDAIDFIRTNFPPWFPDHDLEGADGDDADNQNAHPDLDVSADLNSDAADFFSDSSHSASSYFEDVPFSELECQTAAKVLVAFPAVVPETSKLQLQIPPPRDQLKAWETILQAALIEGIDIANTSPSAWSRSPVADAYAMVFLSQRQSSSWASLPVPYFGSLLARLKIPFERYSCFSNLSPASLSKVRKRVPAVPPDRSSNGAVNSGLDGLTTAAYIGVLLLYCLTACPVSSHATPDFRDSGIPTDFFIDKWASLLPTKWHFLTRLGMPPKTPKDPTSYKTFSSHLPALISPFCWKPGPDGKPKTGPPLGHLAFRAWSDPANTKTLPSIILVGGGEHRQLGLKYMFPYAPSSPACKRSISAGTIPLTPEDIARILKLPLSSPALSVVREAAAAAAAAAADPGKLKWHGMIGKNRPP